MQVPESEEEKSEDVDEMPFHHKGISFYPFVFCRAFVIVKQFITDQFQATNSRLSSRYVKHCSISLTCMRVISLISFASVRKNKMHECTCPNA